MVRAGRHTEKQRKLELISKGGQESFIVKFWTGKYLLGNFGCVMSKDKKKKKKNLSYTQAM